jgi:hypothetical protein
MIGEEGLWSGLVGLVSGEWNGAGAWTGMDLKGSQRIGNKSREVVIITGGGGAMVIEEGL